MSKAAKSKSKPTKEQNPFVLGAEVYRTGLHPALGKIVRVSKTLVTVQWDTGLSDSYGRSGEGFHGRVTADGEAIMFSKSGRKFDTWGSKDEPEIAIATEGAKARIAEERAKKESVKEERARKQAEIEADPAYQQRQAELKRHSDALKGIGLVESSWGDPTNWRIELDGITPEEMPAVVEAIRAARGNK